MREILYRHLDHFLAVLVLLSRLADLGSTYLVTPTLALEGNELARRLRWPFGFATLGVAFVPYVHLGLGFTVGVGSLLVAAQNLRNGWLVRALGEDAYVEILRRAASKSRRRTAFAFLGTSVLLVAFAGMTLLWLDPNSGWAAYFAFGILSYAAANLFHGGSFVLRLFRRAGEASGTGGDGSD